MHRIICKLLPLLINLQALMITTITILQPSFGTNYQCCCACLTLGRMSFGQANLQTKPIQHRPHLLFCSVRLHLLFLFCCLTIETKKTLTKIYSSTYSWTTFSAKLHYTINIFTHPHAIQTTLNLYVVSCFCGL